MDERRKTALKTVGKSAGKAVLFVAVVFALFWICYRLVGNEYLVPSPKETVVSAWAFLRSGAFYRAFWQTFLRAFSAFLFSFVFAVALGVLAFSFPRFSKMLHPIVSFLRTLPTLAVLLVILIATDPKTAPVVVAVLALFPMLFTAVESSLFSVDQKTLEMSRVYKVPKAKQVFKMILPQVLPTVVRESAGALAFSLKLTVSAEIMANTYQSLGGMLQEAKQFTETGKLFALTLIVCLLGFLLETLGNALSSAVERRVK